MPSSPRRIRAAVLGSLLTSIAGLGAIAAVGFGAEDADRPDLTALLPPDSASSPNARWIDNLEIPGRTLFRFDSVILNSGPGVFEVARVNGTTVQRTWDDNGIPTGQGTAKELPAGAEGHYTNRTLTLGGPGGQNALRYSFATGHDHFHSQRIAAYELRTTTGAAVASAAKNLAGFCLYDSWDGTTPQFYPNDSTSCSRGDSSYTGDLRMGISPGWGDLYNSQLWDQWVDVTDVTPGSYTLVATVDPQGIYEESNEGNNTSDPVSVVIPGVIVQSRSASTGVGQAIDIPLAGTVVGAGVRSRRNTTCNVTFDAGCMTTATGGVASWGVSTPTAGSVTRTGATVRYTPPAGFSGTATFTYTGADSRGLASKPATVTVQVGSTGGGGGGGGGLTSTTSRSRPQAVALTTTVLKGTSAFARVKVAGIVKAPAGSAAAQVCTGKVLVRAVAGKRVAKSVRTALRRRAGACRYQVTLAVPKAKIGRARSMKITARFLGSTQLLPRNATTRTVRVR